MNKINILIVDDEPLARKRIIKTISKHYPEYNLIEAVDGLDALEQIEKKSFDIVFLDIQMPELNGFEVLTGLEERNFQVIFQTAFDEFAIEAFEVSATDYLLKPFDDDRLLKSVEKAIDRMENKDNISQKKLEKHLINSKKYTQKIPYRAGQQTHLLNIKDVLYLTSIDHITHVASDSVSYAINNSLQFWEEHLDPKKFIRVHRKYIVQLDKIKSYIEKSSMTLIMSNKEEVKVSREKKKDIKELLHSAIK